MSVGEPLPPYKDVRSIRVCFLGCRGVGKTTIIERFALGQIDDERLAQNEPTIEDIYERSVVRGDTLAIIHLMDSPGAEAETIPGMIHSYMKRAQGFVLLYNTRSRESFERVCFMREEISRLSGKEAPVFLVGTHVDSSIPRTVAITDADAYSKQAGCQNIEMDLLCSTDTLVSVPVLGVVDRVLAMGSSSHGLKNIFKR